MMSDCASNLTLREFVAESVRDSKLSQRGTRIPAEGGEFHGGSQSNVRHPVGAFRRHLRTVSTTLDPTERSGAAKLAELSG